jgi:molybdopterin-guanine dinucleotide biosynthesis protein A
VIWSSKAHTSLPRAPVVGLFVGGRGSRFGGIAKGNLVHPSGARLVERLTDVVRAALPDAVIVLVGERPEYGDLALATLGDTPPGIGPLGGLRALVAFARDEGRDAAVAVACDLPYLTSGLVGRLAHEEPGAAALAPKDAGRWQALTARYGARVLPVLDAAITAREHSLQRIFERLGADAHVLSVDDAEREALRDWDSPDDVAL